MIEHDTWIKRHDVPGCNTAKHQSGGECGTHYETHCSCGFAQGAGCHEQADAVARGHRLWPAAQVITWVPGPPLTADTITDQDLLDLFARHCECRPIDLERGNSNHAAIHDCDTEILSDVQYALGIVPHDDIGRGQAIYEARGRCAEVINDARTGA